MNTNIVFFGDSIIMDLPINYNNAHWSVRKRAREEYIKRQNGLCYHCGISLYDKPKQDRLINKQLFPKNFFDYPIHLHHNHNTGITIGVVHNYYNAVLWQYYHK